MHTNKPPQISLKSTTTDTNIDLIVSLITAGGLSLAVEGPSKADISCHDNKDGTVSVTYLPTAPGEYRISVKFADKHIKGSPYNTKVTGS